MKVLTYFILGSALLLFSCKSDKVERPSAILPASKAKNTNNASSGTQERLVKKQASSNEIATQRAQALAIINHRLKSNSESYAILEADTWEYQFVYNKEMSKPGEYDGIWLDFYADHTYEYGKNSTIQGSGKYVYSIDKGEVVMIDNDTSKKPQEWTIKHADDFMVMIGTATYKDNHIQQKLIRNPESIKQ